MVRELFDGLRIDYENNDQKSWPDVEARWRLHLEPVFGNVRVANIRTCNLKQYQNDRKQQAASNGTINRELAALKRMFTIGLEDDKLIRLPKFPEELDEDASIRKGFLDDEQYSQLALLCAQEGLWMRAMFEAGYRLGWRVGELLNLRVKQVDLAERILRLDAKDTKNGRDREAIMPELLWLLIQQCVAGKQAEEYVFTRQDGTAIRDFRAAWWKVCCTAGVGRMNCKQCGQAVALTAEPGGSEPVQGAKPKKPAPECPQCKTGRRGLRYVGLIFHDLRRTAVRNMVRDGTPESVAMEISGHKTREVFERYNITSSKDKRLAAQRMDERLRAQQQKAAPDEFEHYLSIISSVGSIANAARPN